MTHVVYGAARSGTTIVFQWLFPYFCERLGYVAAYNEYFTTATWPVKVSHRLKGHPWYFWNNLSIAPWPPSAAYPPAIEERLELISASTEKYLIKHISAHDTPEVIGYLSRFPTLIVQRRDTWKQVLSFGLAANTSIWCKTTAGPLCQVHGVTMTIGQFDNVSSQIDRAQDVRRFDDRAVVYYEDFCQDPGIVLDLLGLPRLDYDPYKHPALYPVSEKMDSQESSFANLDEIRLWYDNWRSAKPLFP